MRNKSAENFLYEPEQEEKRDSIAKFLLLQINV